MTKDPDGLLYFKNVLQQRASELTDPRAEDFRRKRLLCLAAQQQRDEEEGRLIRHASPAYIERRPRRVSHG